MARDTFRIVLRTDAPVAVRSGQFVDIAIPGYYLRRPISVSDTLPDGVVLYYKVVGEGTKVLSAMVFLFFKICIFFFWLHWVFIMSLGFL